MGLAIQRDERIVRLGNYLRALREGYGYSLRRVEEKAGELGLDIDNSQLSRYERGESLPSFGKLRILSKIYNIPLDRFVEVFEGENSRTHREANRELLKFLYETG